MAWVKAAEKLRICSVYDCAAGDSCYIALKYTQPVFIKAQAFGADNAFALGFSFEEFTLKL